MKPEQPMPSLFSGSRGPWARRTFLLIVLLLAGGVLAYHCFLRDLLSAPHQGLARNDVPADPRRTYQGPFQNVQPDVQYVGTDACGACHPRIVQSYSQHPMARSLMPIARLAGIQQYDARYHNPFKAFGSILRVDRQGERVWHRQVWLDHGGKPILEKHMEVHYAIGSGLHGHSYLTVEGDGYLVQTPVSWFSQKKIWDASPGFSESRRRPVSPECMFCHANRAFPREGYANRFEVPMFSGHAIGCERCHGPGEKHVQDPGLKAVSAASGATLRAGVKEVDFSIVNPGKLKAELRESVCQQCHLEGESRIIRRGRDLYDFRPGLPLDEFWSVFVHNREADEDMKAINHVQQMYLSRCFLRSQKGHKLGCISCHNPHEHVGPTARLEHYRQRCLQCHSACDRPEGTKRPCTLPRTERHLRNQDDCAACHMPPYATSDIVHAASTDHRILRRPEKETSGTRRPRPPMLAHFHRGAAEADKEIARDLALALAHFVIESQASEAFPEVISRLEQVLQDFPNDFPAWEAKTGLFLMSGRPAEALAAAQTILDKKPEDERALSIAGTAAALLGDEELGLTYLRKLVAVNPYVSERRANLAEILVRKQAWDEASKQCQEWVRLDPANVKARRSLIECLLRTGKRAQARAQFAIVEALRPPTLEQLRLWFAGQLLEAKVK